MAQSGYTPWSVTVGEQPTTAFWNVLGSNDAAFNAGTGLNDGVIGFRQLTSDVVATGTILPYAGSAAPSSNWLVCDGSAVSRTTYSALFAVCGIAYGAGNGSSTFNLPNAQGNVPVGLKPGDANFGVLGATGGESSHTLSVNEMPTHAHSVNDPGHAHGTAGNWMQDAGGAGNQGTNTPGNRFIQGLRNVQVFAALTNIFLSNSGGGVAHNNVQPFVTINYIIKT